MKWSQRIPTSVVALVLLTSPVACDEHHTTASADSGAGNGPSSMLDGQAADDPMDLVFVDTEADSATDGAGLTCDPATIPLNEIQCVYRTPPCYIPMGRSECVAECARGRCYDCVDGKWGESILDCVPGPGDPQFDGGSG